MVLDKIAVQSYEPTSMNVLWIRPTKNGVVLYVPDMGTWRPLEIVDNKGTATISDDSVADITNLDNTIQETVDRAIDEGLEDTVRETVEDVMEAQEYADDEDVEDLFNQ